MMNRTLPLFALLLACGGSQSAAVSGGAGAATAHEQAQAPAPVAGDHERQRVPLDYAPARGPRDAAVTIVAFTDFECPFCQRAAATIEQLREAYPGQVRVVLRQYPLAMHPHAQLASAISLEAYAQGGAELFWRVHDRLFELEEMGRELLFHLAQQVGVDRRRLDEALADGRHDGAIAADIALGQRLGVTGTPAFFINGRPLAGALPFDRFSALVEEEIALAEGLVAQGVAPADVYTALTWTGHSGAPQPEVQDLDARGVAADEETPIFRVPIAGRPPTRGPDDALVTIVTFSDFQCPFCQRVVPTLEQLVERYGSDLRIVWMNNPLPFHNDAKPAAEAALEIYRQQGDAAFWRFHDVVFENQRALSRADLERYAQAMGADMTAFRRALDTHQHEATIEAQQALANQLGARGTPNFFINGRQVQGAQPLERFVEAVDAALAQARSLVAEGVDRGSVYERIIRDGRTEPAPRPEATVREREPEDPDRIYELPIPADAPRQGGRRAQVVIQEMADLQCPFCSRVQTTLEQVRREYGNRVQIVWRDYPLPFHQDAPLAAEAAREVKRQRGDQAFFEFIDIVFANQRELGLEKLVEYASRVRGVNTRRLRRALEQRTHRAAVEADIAAVRGVLDNIGTPTFLINGKKLVGAQPFERFRDAIDDALQAGTTP